MQQLELIELKMELEAGRVTHESPIEEIQALNKLARNSQAASQNEADWLAALHPSIRSMSYNIEHDVPIAQIALDYHFDDSDALGEALVKLARVTADGRDEVEVEILTGGDGYGEHMLISVESGEASVVGGFGNYNHPNFGENGKPIKEAIEWITKNLPFTYPAEKKSSLYPSDDDY